MVERSVLGKTLNYPRGILTLPKPVLGMTENYLTEQTHDPHLSRMAQHARQRALSAVSRPHQDVRREVLLTFLQHKSNIMATLGAWDLQFKPGTALTKAHTLLGLMPHLKSVETRDLLDVWQKENSVIARPAPTITPDQMKVLLTRSPREARGTIVLQWVSGCRHADLLKARMEKVTPSILRMSWSTQKSDRLGKRHLVKFIHFPLQIPQLSGYREVYKRLKDVDPSLTVHSLRRGALTFLATQGYSHETIMKLSLHAPTSDPCLAVRRYVEPSHLQPEAMEQIELSKALWRPLCV
jgi:integrase